MPTNANNMPNAINAELHGFDQATVDRMERILEIIECAVRNITVDKDDESLREYAQLRSELKTLREQSMTIRWPSEVRRLIDSTMSIRDRTAVYAHKGDMAEQVKAMRNDSYVACMFCGTMCDADKMSVYDLFGLPNRSRTVPCRTDKSTPTSLGGYRASDWLNADFKTLKALWVEFLASYNVCDSEKGKRVCEEEAWACRASGKPPIEFHGSFAVGSECSKYLETVMHVQSLPMVVAHDIDIGLDVSSEDLSKKMYTTPEHAIEVLQGLERIREFVAGRPHVLLPDVVGPGPVFEERIMSSIQASLEKKKARPRPARVDDSDDEGDEPCSLAMAELCGGRALQRLREAGRIGVTVVEVSSDDEHGDKEGDSAKRKRARKEPAKSKAAGKRPVEPPRPARKAAARSRTAVRKSARADSEESDHPSDDERGELDEVFERRAVRAKRASIETLRENEMVDEDGFSATEMSAAMAASTAAPTSAAEDGFSATDMSAAMAVSSAAPTSAAERAGRLGDDVLGLLGDVMRSGQAEYAEVWNDLQTAGAALFRVKRALAASNQQQDNGAGIGA